jgi:peptidyl-prolyl cis-trans isomerase C
MTIAHRILLPGALAAFVALTACGPAPTPSTPSPTPTPAPAATPAAQATPAPEASPAGAASPAAAPMDLKDPVAVVNGQPITRAQLEEAFSNAVQSSGVNPTDLTADQKLSGYRQILDDMIMEKLVDAAAAGVQIPQAKIDEEIAKLKSQFPSEEEFNKQLVAAGETPEKLQVAMKKIIRQRDWVEGQIANETDVTDAEAKAYYEQNKDQFDRPETVKASHILFMVDKDAPEADANAKLDAAKKAVTRAKKGEDFTALAKELSEEPGAKESGGDLGFFDKDQMVPEFSEAVFAMKENAISDPVRTQFGWHVIKLTGKEPAGTVSFDEVKDRLVAFLKAEKQRKAVEELLTKLRDSAKVENTLEPAAPPATPAASPAAGN